MTQISPPQFKGAGPGLVPRVGTPAGKILRDDGDWVTALSDYQGGVAGGSVPATSTSAGDYYVITSDGTSQSIDWEAGDLAIYEGSSGNWTQLEKGQHGFATVVELRDAQAQRQVRGRAVSDGSTSHRALRFLPREIGAVAGLPITIWGVVPVLASNPSARTQIHAITDNSGSSSLESSQRNHTLHFYYDTNGDLVVRQIGAVYNDRRSKVYSGFLSAYSDYDFVRVALCFPDPNTTNDFELWVEGVDLAPSMTDNNANTVPNWVPPTMDTTWHLTGYMWPAGEMPQMTLTLGAFSSAEAEAYTRGGRPPAWAERAGSAVPVYESDFSAGVDGWSGELSTTVAGNQDSIGGRDDSLKVEVGGSVLNGSLSVAEHGLESGKSYVMELSFYYPSSNAQLNGFRLTDNGSSSILGDFFHRDLTADTWYDYADQLTIPQGYDLSTIRLVGLRGGSSGSQTVGDKAYVRGLRFREIGSIYRPYYQPGLVVGDQLGRISARALGCVQTPEPGVRDISIDLEFSYSGSSLQILGGSLLGGMDARIVSVSGYSDQNTTGSLGTSSGGTELVNAQTINGDFDIDTFASRIISAGTSLYWTPGANPTAGTLHIVLRPINQGA